jgi:hypothetical protein
MLKLLASAPRDGWAFVEKDQKVLLVRPPYQQWALTHVSEGAVEKAVQHHGFVMQGRSFVSWDSLIGFLRSQYLAFRRRQDSNVPDLQEIRSILHMAPSGLIMKYLSRVESELLPGGEWGPAMELLIYLLGVDTIKGDSTLYDRTLQLLLQTRAALKREEAQRLEIIEWEGDLQRKFPNAIQIYGAAAVRDAADSITRRGQVFA